MSALVETIETACPFAAVCANARPACGVGMPLCGNGLQVCPPSRRDVATAAQRAVEGEEVRRRTVQDAYEISH